MKGGRMAGYTHVVSLGTRHGQPCHWPAFQRENGLIVDLTTLNWHGTGRVFEPGYLRKCEIPENIIQMAATSTPPGFVLAGDEIQQDVAGNTMPQNGATAK